MHCIGFRVSNFCSRFLLVFRRARCVHVFLFDFRFDVFIRGTWWHRWCGCSSFGCWRFIVSFWIEEILVRKYLLHKWQIFGFVSSISYFPENIFQVLCNIRFALLVIAVSLLIISSIKIMFVYITRKANNHDLDIYTIR